MYYMGIFVSETNTYFHKRSQQRINIHTVFKTRKQYFCFILKHSVFTNSAANSNGSSFSGICLSVDVRTIQVSPCNLYLAQEKADSRSVSLEPNATLVAILVTNIGKFAEKCQKQQFTTTFAGFLNSHRFTHQLIVLYVLANTA